MSLQILTITEIAHKYHLSKEEKKDFQILLFIVSLMASLSSISLTALFFLITGA